MLLLVLLGAMGSASWSRAQEPSPGQVVEKIVCRTDSNQSYALYLPSYYSPDQEWPILYALDAGARGGVPVQRFKAGAEKYGYIVAGSNNSQNGPIRVVEEALDALIADTESRFALDGRRVYMAGFSGGARVAVAAAFTLKGKVAGVIACGAGFPPSIQPSASQGFAFFGAVGTEDFYFPELRKLDQTLGGLGATHRLEIFQGGHEWPPEPVCTRAIAWIEIQAMKHGIRSPDAGRIDEMYAEAAAEAESLESARKLYEAQRRYSALAEDFAGLKDIAAFAAKAEELEKSREVKKALDQEKEVDQKQRRIETQLLSLLARATGGDNRAIQVQELISSFISLRKQADQTRNEPDRLVAVRVLTSFWIRLGEEASLDFEESRYGLAAMHLELMSQIRPDNPHVYYQLARAYARKGDKGKTLKALQAAVSRGFRDGAALEKNPDFKAVTGDPAFQRILADLRNRSD